MQLKNSPFAITWILLTYMNSVLSQKLSNNKFATKLISTVSEQYEEKNVVLSPISIQTIGTLIFMGAQGQTADELRRALVLRGKPPHGIAVDFKNLLNGMDSAIGPGLQVHNKIFADIDAVVNPAFAEIARKYFKTDIQKVDFTLQEKTANTINNWILDVTGNNIKKIVDADDIDEVKTTVLIASSAYFNWEWEKPFDPLLTRKLPFNLNVSQSKKVTTLYQKAKFRYGNIPELKASAIELPYKNINISMLIILPDAIDGLAELEQNFKKFPLENITEGFEYDEVFLKLPRFDFGFVLDMQDPLKEMGIRLIFGEEEGVPDLTEMFPQPFNIYISKFVHKAAIEVYEFRTEAYAAPVSGAAFRAAPVPFTIDRPFLFLVRSKNIVYYIGHVVDPEMY